jgi:hypothetical protein
MLFLDHLYFTAFLRKLEKRDDLIFHKLGGELPTQVRKNFPHNMRDPDSSVRLTIDLYRPLLVPAGCNADP